ncbi:Acyl-CoA dehydrogenase [Corynebacterium capitovis DSM 44611]|uniref:acyl-CoA dehydrogenase family protein n=1 Tax=Corynebacterium capitovis TaxID=131081 RepID=UPI0003607A8D|nr:acyl-CoA dehydrogenase family protein [Corynebacterium capitovis]WKD58403.1 Acyl-CoA dehydrogenase [Corynebacterium capitovis DSM 44611]
MSDASDLIDFDSLLSQDETAWRDGVREFVEAEIKPRVGQWYEDAYVPLELIPEFAKRGMIGAHLSGYGCPGRSAVDYGLAMLEVEAADSGLRTILSVLGSLAMTAIYKHGSEEQKREYLPRMAAGELLGAFGLTEPRAGSDPASMTTRAAYSPKAGWVLNGEKRWIGLAHLADITVIWAKVSTADLEAAGFDAPQGREETIAGFLVPKGTPGFTATPIEKKLSMRVSTQSHITLVDATVPHANILPATFGLKAPLTCLNEARYGIGWGVLGAARDSLEQALAYAGERTQFGRPITGFQLTQKKLVDMAAGLNQGYLLALHVGRHKDADTLDISQISLAKLQNTRTAIDICREARTIFGGNGIIHDYSPIRHAANLESVRTYEGTDEMHTLILGQKMTGISAFS